MSKCDVCGNEYDKAFQVNTGGKSYTFDSIECAASIIALQCSHCHCRILGHGMEANGKFYCCAHCANMAGAKKLVDRQS